MNKRELIEHINNKLFDNLKDTLFTEPTLSITESAKDNKVTIAFETEQGGLLVGGMLKKFEKVTIPQFVADWIEYCKNTFLSLALARALMIEEVDFYNYANQKDYFRLVDFLGSGINQEKFARAWFDGYEIEPEKRYTVKVRANGEYLNWSVMNTFYFSKKDKTYFVKRKLENAGFGWVFDCKGIEVKEVKE